jgi:BirA family biotin operon repressor/biotin-[acetyl-CoA-carboxylase] ligase
VSLNQISGSEVDRDEFLRLLLDAFFRNYDEFLESGFSSIRERYIAKCPYLGRRITVSTVGGVIIGEAEGFNDDGALIVVNDSGEMITVTEGDVD